MFAIASAVVLAIVGKALADPSPLTPGTVNVGGDCVISWAADTTGTWTETNIQLMSGDNWNMVPITTIATVDTTSAAPTSYTWKCPAVSPNSPIYFYQFSHAEEPTKLLWTTRFTIAGANGATVPAVNQVQPDGTNVPWGVGRLANPSEAKPAPAYITGQSAAAGSSAVATASGAATATVPVTATAGSATISASRMTTSSAAAVARTSSASAKASTTASASTASASANAGERTSPAKTVALAFGAVAAAGLLAMA